MQDTGKILHTLLISLIRTLNHRVHSPSSENDPGHIYSAMHMGGFFRYVQCLGPSASVTVAEALDALGGVVVPLLGDTLVFVVLSLQSSVV